ncbi:rRNA maturation RNase YbeY [Accumulibacter sp.]|uniref:rRNA maturation RNase YbeY n=1 Tax=Accumulibacter sp. TaxID=2053492 RepID=UPI00262E7138|nr:rRNA maturation RNase YbeY [Accumulibacter sp.]
MAKKTERRAAGGDTAVDVGVQYACKRRDLPRKPQLRAWVRAAAAANGDRVGRIVVRLVGKREGRRLNREYRGGDGATNVLSFPYALAPLLCGDLVLCAPVVSREAAEQGKSLAAHCAHLVVHGVLHLQEYDHEAGEQQARDMEDRERRILAALGYPDPYDDED